MKTAKCKMIGARLKKGFGGTNCVPKTGLHHHIEPYMSARFVIPSITQWLRCC